MTYYIYAVRLDAYGKPRPYKGKLSFTSLTQARAALIKLIESAPSNLMFHQEIYEGLNSPHSMRGRVSKFGKRWKWDDFRTDEYQYEIYKNGKIKKVWMW